ncbi:hypothetical protein LCGC14_1565530, partial [marine sediment metagenome]
DAHLAVIRELERHGLGLLEEVEFPPYRADIYLPAYHVLSRSMAPSITCGPTVSETES